MTASGAAGIRMVEAGDVDGVLAIYAPFIDTPVTFETEVPSVAEMLDRTRTVSARWPWLVFERGGLVDGYAYASAWRSRAAYRWSVETTVYVRADARGRGVGRALYRSLFRCLELQGFRLAIGAITLPNPASVALHESFGFRRLVVYRACGFKLGAWHDVGVWEREIAPRDDREPPEPLTPVALAADPAWGRALASGLAG